MLNLCLADGLRCLEEFLGLYGVRGKYGLKFGGYGRVGSKMEKKRALKLP